MDDRTHLESLARQLLDREWQAELRRAGARPGHWGDGDPPMQCRCATGWLLHDLVELVADRHEVPVAELEPTIRLLILERSFMDSCGDTVPQESDPQAWIDREARVLVRVLEQVRQSALQAGAWSEVPVGPQMFG